jgi:hypothetical protein
MMDMDLALRADHLRLKHGFSGKELGAKLKVSTEQAHTLASVGATERERQMARLTVPEQILITCLAQEHAHLLSQGRTSSPKTADVSWRARKSAGWAATTANKRLFDERYDQSERRHIDGLGFVHVAGNGYIWLTPAGWMLAHALGVTS